MKNIYIITTLSFLLAFLFCESGTSLFARSLNNPGLITIDLVELARKIQANEDVTTEEVMLFNLTGLEIDITSDESFQAKILELANADFGAHLLGNYYMTNYHSNSELQQEVANLFEDNPNELAIECKFDNSNAGFVFITHLQTDQVESVELVNSYIENGMNDYFTFANEDVYATMVGAHIKGFETLLCYVSGDCNNDNLMMDGLENELEDIMTVAGLYYLSPAGIPLFLPKGTLVRFFGASTAPATFQGCLRGFTLPTPYNGDRIFEARHDKQGGFVGYSPATNAGNTYAYAPQPVAEGSEIKIVLGYRIGQNSCEYHLTEEVDFTVGLSNVNAIGPILTTISLPLATFIDFQPTCMPDMTRAQFENDVYAKYNPTGDDQLGLLMQLANGQIIYSNIETDGSVYHLRYNPMLGIWEAFYPPPNDCLSCEMLGFMGSFFDGIISFMENPDGHVVLDIIGIIPVVGEVADIANGVWYLMEGETGKALLSFAATTPVLGAAATAGKYIVISVGAAAVVVKSIAYIDEATQLMKAVKVDKIKTFLKDVKGYNTAELNKLAANLSKKKDLLKAFAKDKEKYGRVWILLKRAGKNAVTTGNKIILDKFDDLLKHPKFAGISTATLEATLAGMKKGWPFSPNYVDFFTDIKKMLDEALPSNVDNILGFLGAKGLGNAGTDTQRHAWIGIKRLIENKGFYKNVNHLEFELANITHIVNGRTFTTAFDMRALKGATAYINEVKGGLHFFTSGLNPKGVRQITNGILESGSVKRMKVTLNPEIRDEIINDAAKFASAKTAVIKGLNEKEGGAALIDGTMRDLFRQYRKEVSGVDMPFLNAAQLKSYLESTDDWFREIFIKLQT